MGKFIDISGQKFGRLIALSVSERRGHGYSVKWNCRCDCGKQVIVDGSALRQGNILSCGCYKSDITKSIHTKHGMAQGSRLYRLWSSMKNRCKNPSTYGYRWYGAKGIKVCPEWQEFEPFQKWAIANGYTDKLTIDRIDSNKDYFPENCRWIPLIENISRASKGHKMSKDARKIISEKNKGLKPRNRIKIRCIETGVVYDSGADASKAANQKHPTAIWEAVRKGTRCGGYHWVVNDSPITEYIPTKKLCPICQKEFIQTNVKHIFCSMKCVQRAAYERKKEKNKNVNHICPVCGNPYKGYEEQICCGRVCQNKYRAILRRVKKREGTEDMA